MRKITPALVVLAAAAACSTASLAAPAAYASLAGLPDWSGAWGLDDASFKKTVQASGAPDGDPNVPPLTPAYRKMRDENGAANGGQGPAGKGVDTNSVKCLPDGVPGIMTAPFAFEALFTPGRVTLIPEDNEVRRIYTDGRAHAAHPDPTFEGDSIGHWDGDTLVVDTVGIKPTAELFVGLHVSGPQTHVVERMRKVDDQTFRIDTTVTDPVALTRPWSYTRTFKKSPAGMTEYFCTENNRDSNGSFDLTPPPQ